MAALVGAGHRLARRERENAGHQAHDGAHRALTPGGDTGQQGGPGREGGRNKRGQRLGPSPCHSVGGGGGAMRGEEGGSDREEGRVPLGLVGFGFGPSGTSGVEGQGPLHQGVPAVAEGVAIAALHPRQLHKCTNVQMYTVFN